MKLMLPIVLIHLSLLQSADQWILEQGIIQKIDRFFKSNTTDSGMLNEILSSGDIGGFYSPTQVYGLVKQLSTQFPQFVSPLESVGASYQGRKIYTFRLGRLDDPLKKSQVLFTALHHSREAMSLAMILKIFLTKLHQLVHSESQDNFFFINEIVFLPMVNVDGYHFIAENYNQSQSDVFSMKRKNFNHTIACQIGNKEINTINSGVDLNRNYDFKFGFDEEGSVNDPCDEIYRGSAPFSELETQAVRRLVEESGRISSAMNLHAYGNLWIHPFCYYKGDDYAKLLSPKVFEFYKAFDDQLRSKGFNKTGTAQQTIGYIANGEASDWMLAKHGIISFSPELGNDDKESQNFFTPKSSISKIIDYNFEAIQTFLNWNLPVFTQVKFSANRVSNYQTNSTNYEAVVEFSNDGIANLYNVSVVIEYQSGSFALSFVDAEFNSDDSKVDKISLKDFGAIKKATLSKKITINKLSTNRLRILFSKSESVDFALTFFRKDQKIAEIRHTVINQLSNLGENEFVKSSGFIVFIGLIAAALIAVIGFLAYKFIQRCRKSKQETAMPTTEQTLPDIEQAPIKMV